MGDIPDNELAEILERRCGIAPSYAKKLVATMRELQRRRQVSHWEAPAGCFEHKRVALLWQCAQICQLLCWVWQRTCKHTHKVCQVWLQVCMVAVMILS